MRQRPPEAAPADEQVIRRLRQRAIRLLSRREYSANELRNRLVSGSSWARRRARVVSNAKQAAGADNAADTEQIAGGEQSAGTELAADGRSELAVLVPEPERAPTAEELDQVIDQLQSLDLQSDYRFAESLVRRRGARQGVSQLHRLLQNHQIDPAICAELLDPLAQSEFDRAREVWAQRFDRYGGGQRPSDLRERSRQARFLTSRGFSADVVSRVLRSAGGRGAD